jgi:DNA-binding winged helix-turn-helix (wHTH) protein
MLYLIENPILREGFFPSDPHQYVMDDARHEDRAAVLKIADRHLPARAAQSVSTWWDRIPQAFRVARDASGAVAAFMIVFERSDVPVAWLEDDPITAAELAHLRANPVAPTRRVLFGPAFVTRDGEKPSGPQAACWLDIKRMYMELRPDLHRIYTGVYDIETWAPIVAPLGFQPIGTVDLGERTYYLSVIEFGYASVDGWLAGLVGAELGIDEDHDVLDESNRQLILDGQRTDLTRLEFAVIRCLLRHDGHTVRRATLLAEAWGYEDPAGSNVVEAVIRSLRRKLGPNAGAIETVRGLGYRINAHTLHRARAVSRN